MSCAPYTSCAVLQWHSNGVSVAFQWTVGGIHPESTWRLDRVYVACLSPQVGGHAEGQHPHMAVPAVLLRVR